MQTLITIKVFDLDLILGCALKDLGRFNEAIRMFDYALLINPNKEEIYYNKGIQ